MKVQSDRSCEFQPITIKLTLENLEEVQDLYFLFSNVRVASTMEGISMNERQELCDLLARLCPVATGNVAQERRHRNLLK